MALASCLLAWEIWVTEVFSYFLVSIAHLPSYSVGGVFAGRLSDTMVKKWRNRRGGEWVPEDRLRAMLFSAAVLLPVSVLGSGFATRFVGGPIGLTLNLIFLFLNGVGVSAYQLPS